MRAFTTDNKKEGGFFDFLKT